MLWFVSSTHVLSAPSAAEVTPVTTGREGMTPTPELELCPRPNWPASLRPQHTRPPTPAVSAHVCDAQGPENTAANWPRGKGEREGEGVRDGEAEGVREGEGEALRLNGASSRVNAPSPN